MKLILGVLLIALSSGCAARSSNTSTAGSPSRAADGAIIQESSVRAHMEFLASDAMNGRGSGTRDEWIAVTYVASHLRRLGLEPMGDDGGYIQTISMERPDLSAPPVLTIGSRKFTHGAEITVGAMSAATVSGAVARHTKGTPAARGTAIVTPAAAPIATELAGASLILTKTGGCGPQRGPAGALPRVATRTIGVAGAPPRPTCIALNDEAYAAAEGAEAGATVTLAGPTKEVVRTQTWNAVGRLPGSDSTQAQEVILLSAHIDHVGTGRAAAAPGADTIYNGADDDASGSIAVLELAEAFVKGERPKRTIVFGWFGSEESGGTGSRYFADKPVVPLDKIVANLQFEMIGRPDAKVPPHTLWLTGYERSTLGPELAKRGAKLVQDPHPDQSFFTRSDNIQFARRGVIAHTVSSFGLHKDYHQASDEIDTIDFAHMTDSIRSIVAPIRWLASSSFKPDWLPGQKPQ